MRSYAVTAPGGAVLTQQPTRFLAVAKAAEVLRERNDCGTRR